MNVSILLITHNGIGQSICDTVAAIRGTSVNKEVECLSVPAHLKPENLGYFADQIRNSIRLLNKGNGVLILTDIYGATPNNLARYFSAEDGIRVISGLNLPMLVRVLNYIDKPLLELVEIALEGGHKGIRQDL
ncbi:MAG: PTS fructose transporter subunit IIA [Gammaproteobacteria bacterium]|nr:PTS fructose transporter subunit IIA [Gammaproteobacteria bacterium]